uniref:Uncharacterized protein n=1 Tax=Strombidinopsis acuminata TaxID=141414 RepID=A0A7S3VXY7_9SPIT|mmetsp:Transcript_49471/g.127675  ORF Transcript_49471/g.127675 Transcript_49471/m.127675 type:complete len:201 (-) Transcript_49471:377-979(-)
MRRPICGGALCVLLLLTAGTSTAGADSVIDILGQLKTFRSGALELFDSAATALVESGEEEEAAKVRKWSDDWLSILGVSTGLTGLAKDFVVNYLGRSSYHDQNGYLVSAINQVSSAFPDSADGFDEDTTNAIRQRVIVICREGMTVFAAGGSLHSMLSELRGILKTSNVPHFTKGLQSNAEVQKLFKYMAGPKPETSDEL